ncbi:hypothetical protein [Cellulosimicrobium protaetiae]
MSDPVIIQLVSTAGLIVVAILGNRKLNRIGADAKASRQQTENEHAEAEYPNLRDELTATRGEVKGMARHLAHLARWMRDLATADTDLEAAADRAARKAARDLARAVEERDEKLAELREEIPRVIRSELAQHVEDCPLRNPPGV